MGSLPQAEIKLQASCHSHTSEDLRALTSPVVRSVALRDTRCSRNL